MRIRRKPWARPEIAACPFCVAEPAEHKGKWKKLFSNPEAPLHIELGCGKGGFVSKCGLENPLVNFIALDIKPEMLGIAKRKVEDLYRENARCYDNIRLSVFNIDKIESIFDEHDSCERIYINFCNPWPKSKHKKRRLTYHRLLMKYRAFLCGELWFKTDDDGLFDESLEYFAQTGYEIKYLTRDLHESGFTDSVETEHEKMFAEAGKKIKFLIAVPKPISYEQYRKNIEAAGERL